MGNGRRCHGTLAISWGPYGGFYAHRARGCHRVCLVCLGWVAVTLIRVELDDLMEAYAASPPVAR